MSGRTAPIMTPLVIAVTLFGLLIGHLILTYDVTGTASIAAFEDVCGRMGAWHWTCVAIGLFGAFRVVGRGL